MKKISYIAGFIMLLFAFSILFIKIDEKDANSSQEAPISLENEILNLDEDGNEIDISDYASTNDGYYYQKMSETMKNVYDEIYEGILNGDKKIKITKIKESDLKKVFYCLTFDNPELIQITDNFNYDVVDEYVKTFYPDYTICSLEYSKRIKEINSEVLKVQTATKDFSDYEKELYIHDYLLKKCIYSSEGENVANLYGALIEGKANCRGYSAAFSYLLNSCNVVSGQLIGTTTKNGITEGHSWNFVILDDEYYYCDVCWDDVPSTSDYTDVDYHYSFFNLTYDEISNTHSFSNQKKYLYDVKETNNEKYSYMKTNGLFAYNYDEACDIINNKLPYAINTNKKSFAIQCDSNELYQELCNNITDIIKELIKTETINIKHCKYIKIDSGNTIIIHDFVK